MCSLMSPPRCYSRYFMEFEGAQAVWARAGMRTRRQRLRCLRRPLRLRERLSGIV